TGGLLVLVGDLKPQRALDLAEASLEAWAPGSPSSELDAPAPMRPGPTVIVDRPGAVQTNVRIGGPAVPRGHPDHPALALANLVFGGYFISRLVENIRERKGYTYSPNSRVDQLRSASHFVVSADVGTDVTAAALVEIRYELGRMVTTLAEPAELLAAKRYLWGSLSMGIQTQSGLAGTLAMLARSGLDVRWLRDYPRQVHALDAAQVREAAARYLAPRGLATVLVGDVSVIGSAIEAFEPVDVRTAGG
ncbi:MAG: M16 family metallopeptidase, partial [Acidimicrobiales bacterium]